MSFSGKVGSLYPPGYEYRRELKTFAWLAGAAFAVSLHYYVSLKWAADLLYDYDVHGEKILNTGRVALSFLEIVRREAQSGYLYGFFIPVFFLAAMAAYHYVYYYRDTKSIYLMRRLPERGTVLKSCLAGPFFTAGVLLALISVWGLVCMGFYFLTIPGDCWPRIR